MREAAPNLPQLRIVTCDTVQVYSEVRFVVFDVAFPQESVKD